VADIGQVLGDYKIRSLLHTGPVSQVFEVVEQRSNRHFAMKILLPEHSDNPAHRKQLFNDAEIGIELRHENVINIVKVSRSENTPHFVMEFFPSGSIRKRLQSKDPKDKDFLKEFAKKIMRQTATGLAYMNASGYVHLDIKPDNILVNALGQTKIADFAISRRTKVSFFAKLFRKKVNPEGTASYMSPEQINGLQLDGRSDIYSFACTAYEVICGRPPFRGNSTSDLLRKHLMEKPSPIQAHNPDVTDPFSALLTRMLAKKKEDRPKTFHEVLMELRKVRIFKSIPDKDDDEQRGQMMME
jgi:eukaryotic-like serine/threonine-protein kinase